MSTRIPSWLQYAWVEWKRLLLPFGTNRSGKTFLTVAGLLALLITLISMSHAIHRGLVVNFADSLLGYVPGSGVPIRVSFGPGLESPKYRIRVRALFSNAKQLGASGSAGKDTTSLAGYEFHAYSEIEANGAMILPKNTWVSIPVHTGVVNAQEKISSDETNELIQVPFAGWAVAHQSPMWRAVEETLGGNRLTFDTIILSRALFDRHFYREGYLKALKTNSRAPAPLIEQWERENPPGAEVRSLIFDIPYRWVEGGDRLRRHHLFPVRYIGSIQGIGTLAFLSTLELQEPLARATYETLISYLPGINARDENNYIGRIDVDDVNLAPVGEVDKALQEVLVCLGRDAQPNKIEAQSYLQVVRFTVPQPRKMVEACLARVRMPDEVTVTLAPRGVMGARVRDGQLLIRCADLRSIGQSRPELEPCRVKDDGNKIPTGQEFSYSLYDQVRQGFVFTNDRGKIDQIVMDINDSRIGDRQAVVVGSLYANSLDRFHYLAKTLNYIVLPAIVFLIAVVGAALLINTSMFFSQRKRTYGILLTNGMNWKEIWAIVVLQYTMSFIVASIISLAAIVLTKLALARSFSGSDAYRIARDKLGVSKPALMDSMNVGQKMESAFLSWNDVAFGGLVVGILLLVVLISKLIWLPLRPTTLPIEVMEQ